jgi:replicative DNA helicase
MLKIKKSLKYVDKYLPHNFLAEKIVLSTLLISSEAIEITLRKIKIETFYFKNHQEIYKAIIFLYQNKSPIDILTLTTFLQDQGLLKQVGGIETLSELINQIPNLVYLEEYIQLMQDKFLRRLLIQLGYKIISSSYVTNIPLENIIFELEKQFSNLTSGFQTETVLSSAELFSKILLKLKEKSLSPSLAGLSSGFYDLDSITQGFQNSDLIIVAGRPSMGKTAFCTNIALNILKKYKSSILFFSLEMSKEQLIYRILANETEINNFRLKTGHLYQNDWVQINKVIENLSSLPLFIYDLPNLSINDIRLKIQKTISEQNQVSLIIIDYLQLMQYSKQQVINRVQELSTITRGLKGLAREFKVPIIALSQLSRSVENRINKRPILSDLRESGSIEQDADLVLMLYRDSYYNSNNKPIDITELIIAKQRNGPIGHVQLIFDAKYTKFRNS